MRLGFKQVLGIFGRVLQLHGGKSTALTGRLKHFQRAHFPNGTNVGPGARAAYGVSEILALGFAFRLLALRFTPGAAAAAVSANWNLLAEMSLEAWERRGGAPIGPDAGPLIVRIAADGLEDLRRGGFEDGPPDPMVRVEQRQVWSWMRGVDPLPDAGLILLDVEQVTTPLLHAIDELGLASPLDLAKGFHLMRMALLAQGEADAVRWEH